MPNKNFKYYNIFCGNNGIDDQIIKSLELDDSGLIIKSWATESMYFQAYFYLCQRFGLPKKTDDYKIAAIWEFGVKHYLIIISIDSTNVNFYIYGKQDKKTKALSKKAFHNYHLRSPDILKSWRASRGKEFISSSPKPTKKEKIFRDFHFNKFQIENGYTDLSAAQYNENKELKAEFDKKWWNYIHKFNNETVGVNIAKTNEKFGRIYSNSHTRHALRTLDQFLKNMLTPISVRDVCFNIKGVIPDEKIRFYERYENNLEIKLRRNKKESQ